MQPNDNRQQASIVVPPRSSTSIDDAQTPAQQAAAEVVRSQLDAIYHKDPNLTQPEQTTANSPETHVATPATTGNLQYDNQQAAPTSPYHRTHDEQRHTTAPGAWDKYHSAWQSYYQQYYERYYTGQVHQIAEKLSADKAQQPADAPLTTDEAMYDLRSNLRKQIEHKATKVRKSRHFAPAIAALCVMIVFVFLQYNRVLFANVAAYVSPGNMDPSTLIVDPSASIDVGEEPKLIIPKITVQVPIIWDAVASDQNSLNAAMDKGVAWFNIPGANARPGEKGNFVLSGHSSNDWLDGGDYKFIFARLEQIKEGDTIYVNYNKKRYTYTVTSIKVVKPTDVSALVDDSNKPRITLVTCTPLGTALNRLLVFGDQVSPDPNAAVATSTTSDSKQAAKMPSNSPTFLQRLFGGN